MKNTGIIERKKTVFILIDVQDGFVPVIHGIDSVIDNCNVLIRAAEILDIPLLVTEQYPKGLGKTVEKIILPPGVPVIKKVHFNCFGSDEFSEGIRALDVSTLVLFGIETHVCLLNTALHALEKGYEVHVIADAVSSRTIENREIALERMRQSGAFISSVEMIIFQLMEKAGTAEFKKILQLIK